MQARDPVSLRTGQAGRRPTTSQLVEQGSRVRDDMGTLIASARELARNGEAFVRERLEDQPYATLAIAAGAGYVLGGGLPITLVRTVLALGGRLALERMLVQVAPSTAANGEHAAE